jgi:hypothetical protein
MLVAGGASIKDKFEAQGTQAVVAFSEGGEVVELTSKIKADGTVDWVAPLPKEQAQAAKWKVYAISQKPSRQKVKRAAPGGAGYMLNPFFGQAIRDYLPRFEEAFAKYEGPRPRAVYQDSYEYQSNWSPDLFAQFEKRRGYRLQSQLPALFDDAKENDIIGRVKGDYRETISDLMVEEFMPPWVTWAHDHKMITRTQSHGSPGNLLDLYAAADVPETEMFSKDRNPLVAKFASSAAHVTGKRLVSSETGTWLAEHFTETLGEMKRLQDELFVSGVNHIFYHGTCYSPDEAAWPGWCFYASTEMNPRNAIWHDVGTLNAYVARCQSVLQAGEPDNDVLLYWPIHDLWHSLNGMIQPLTVHHTDWLTQQPIGRDAKMLWQRGYCFDYVSDRQLHSGMKYRMVVVPPCTHMPIETMLKLIEMARGGATVIFHDHLPADVPGLGNLENRRVALKALTAELKFNDGSATIGTGKVIVGDLEAALAKAGAAREAVADQAGVMFIRRTWAGGHHYFITNSGEKALDDWVPLARITPVVALMDPMTGRAGIAATGVVEGKNTVRLQLQPGESVIVRTFAKEVADAPKWTYENPALGPAKIQGTWKVKFVEGGPELPAAYETAELGSWTEQADERAKAFAGSAVYTLTFNPPTRAQFSSPGGWIIDLGKVCHSARVRVNGKEVGTAIMAPYRVMVDKLKDADNVLEVEVTNQSANRIRDLDRRGVKWKNFEDINVVNIDYKPFDASKWEVRESGLLGPVTLTPLK